MSKPSIPKGTRDFSPAEMVRRNYIFDTIRKSFQLYGYQPIETPAMEKVETLMGKYGEEGDRLIFKILSRGAKMDKALDKIASGETAKLAEEALRYDLTVPFARYVVQHQNDITFPFKRYQIQPVWRADRPQRGRYREFFQCDADVVGSDSLLFEVELVQLFDEVLTNLNIPDFTIKINNRKILSGIAEVTGESDKLIDMTVAIDKLDKIGPDGVVKELTERGISDQAIEKIKPLFDLKGTNSEVMTAVREMLSESDIGMAGADELDFVFKQIDSLGLRSAKFEFDVTLARGLNYYTGAIFEVKANGVSIGSICGGGRYDDLTSIFGLPNVSGVGISFGADRIYDVLEELELFPKTTSETTRLMFVNFGETEADYCMQALAKVRKAGINAEIYPSAAKMKKQMTYANSKGILAVALVGTQEIEENKITLKLMESGDQHSVSIEELIEKLKQ